MKNASCPPFQADCFASIWLSRAAFFNPSGAEYGSLRSISDCDHCRMGKAAFG